VFSTSNCITVLVKLAFLCLAVAWIGAGSAEASCGAQNEKACAAWKIGFRCDSASLAPNPSGICKPCGHRDGQPACETMRPGPRCFRYMENIDGVCRARGGQGQRPYSGVGFDCKPRYNVGSDGMCTACGGDQQILCEAARPGARCNNGLESYDGLCQNRGDNGEKAWPARRIGFRCNEANLAPNNDNVCVPCGGIGQVQCETMRPGNRCTAAYTQEIDGICKARGGHGELAFEGIGFDCRPGFNYRRQSNGEKRCEPCGGQGQLICELARPGKPCNEGLSHDFRWGRAVCVADEPELDDLVYEAAIETLQDAGEGIFNAIMPMAFEIHEDQDTLEGIENEDGDAAEELEGGSQTIAEAFDFKTLSVGVTAEANFIIGVGVESGVAFDITEDDDPMKWYSSVAISNQLGAGSSYGGVVGVWNTKNDELGDPLDEGGAQSVGMVFDIRTVLEFAGYKSNMLADIGTQSSTATILVGVWFAREEDVTDYKDLTFTGITLSPVIGVGTNVAGTTYVEATTVQSNAPSSGEFTLAQLDSRTLSGGTQINRCFGQCWIEGLGREVPQYASVLPVSVDTTLSATRSVDHGDAPAQEESAPGPTLAGSLWMFEVQGQKLYLKVVEANLDSVVIQRANSSERTTYSRIRNGEYADSSGQRVSWTDEQSGTWVSADGSRSYVMVRVSQ